MDRALLASKVLMKTNLYDMQLTIRKPCSQAKIGLLFSILSQSLNGDFLE